MIAHHRQPLRSRVAAVAFAAALVTAPAFLLSGAATAEDDAWAGSEFDRAYNLTESSTLDEITGVFKRGGWEITGSTPNSGDNESYITGGKLGTPGCGEINDRARWTGNTDAGRHFVIEREADLGWEPSFEFPCNGTYRVSISTNARSCKPSQLDSSRCQGSTARVWWDKKTISSRITVAVPPVAARNVAASMLEDSPSSTTEPEEDGIEDLLPTDDEPNVTAASAAPAPSATEASVEVTWKFPSEPEPDATYVVQRAGPNSGSFKPVSDVLEADDDDSLIDTVSFSGTYDYRVLAVRPAATDDETVATASKVASVEVTGLPDPPGGDDDGDDDGGNDGDDGAGGDDVPPDSGSSGGGPLPSLGGSGQGGSAGGGASPSTRPTVTTLDTGYDDTLDYGDLAEPGELAAEGQSIIRTPDFEGPAILPAIAGGLVLLGWAGHAFYLSRLARQF